MKKVISLILAFVLIFSIVGCSEESVYKKAIENHYKLMMKPSKALVKSFFPKSALRYSKEEYGVTVENILKCCKDYSTDMIAEMEEEVGSGVKITVEILESIELDKSDKLYDNVVNMLEKIGVEAKEIKEIVQVEFQTTVESEKDKDTDTDETYLVKIDKNWYVYSSIVFLINEARFAKD